MTFGHEGGYAFNQDQRDSHPEPFTFLCAEGKPVRAERWGGEWWFFYWHEHQKSWVSLRRASPHDLMIARRAAMSRKDEQIYQDLHRQWVDINSKGMTNG